MPDPAARFRTAIDLHEAGVQIMRLQRRRKHPQASEEELARRFFEWLKGPDEEVPGFRRVERLEVLAGVELPVARLGHLLAMKLLSAAPGRPNGAADLVALMAEADDDELQRCAGALDLITQRGFHRGRDLQAALADLRRECGRA